MLKKNIDTTKLIEIDRTKVFTWAFAQIKFITAFNSWTRYSDDVDFNVITFQCMKHIYIYNKLSENYIKAHSVKSDAFTIHEDDLT